MKFINDKALTEHFEKEYTFFRITDNYRPNYHKSAVTSKFYSKYDALDLSKANDELVTTIKKYRDKGPKDKFAWPATENQTYGWFNTPLVPLRKDDERYYFGTQECHITKHEIKLINDRSMKIERFKGVPFKLQ